MHNPGKQPAGKFLRHYPASHLSLAALDATSRGTRFPICRVSSFEIIISFFFRNFIRLAVYHLVSLGTHILPSLRKRLRHLIGTGIGRMSARDPAWRRKSTSGPQRAGRGTASSRPAEAGGDEARLPDRHVASVGDDRDRVEQDPNEREPQARVAAVDPERRQEHPERAHEERQPHGSTTALPRIRRNSVRNRRMTARRRIATQRSRTAARLSIEPPARRPRTSPSRMPAISTRSARRSGHRRRIMPVAEARPKRHRARSRVVVRAVREADGRGSARPRMTGPGVSPGRRMPSGRDRRRRARRAARLGHRFRRPGR